MRTLCSLNVLMHGHAHTIHTYILGHALKRMGNRTCFGTLNCHTSSCFDKKNNSFLCHILLIILCVQFVHFTLLIICHFLIKNYQDKAENYQKIIKSEKEITIRRAFSNWNIFLPTNSHEAKSICFLKLIIVCR